MNSEYIKNIIKYPISRKSRNWIKQKIERRQISGIKLIMTLLVKNEEEIVEKHIRYHKSMGVDGFIVTSHNSTDKTNEILEKLKKEGLILEIIYETDPHYHQSKFVDKMIRKAKFKYKANWIINADADEFYYSKDLDFKKSIYKAVKAKLNTIWVDSIFLFPDDKENYLIGSNYFVTKPFQEFEAEVLGILEDEKFGEFIGSQGCTKVIHNTKDYIKIQMGNHDIKMRNNSKRLKTSDIVLYHYHIRNYKQQEEKVKRYIDTIMPNGCGTHILNMIKLFKNKRLKNDYYDKLFGSEMREFLIKEGVVSIDKSVSNFIKWKGITNKYD